MSATISAPYKVQHDGSWYAVIDQWGYAVLWTRDEHKAHSFADHCNTALAR